MTRQAVYVEQVNCDERHSATRRSFGRLYALIGVFVLVVVGAVGAAYAAIRSAHDAELKAGAAQVEVRQMNRRSEEMHKDVREIRAEQRELITIVLEIKRNGEK